MAFSRALIYEGRKPRGKSEEVTLMQTFHEFMDIFFAALLVGAICISWWAYKKKRESDR